MMGRKIRILHITGSFSSGGVESYLLNLLSLADFDRFEHYLFVGGDEGPLKEHYHKLPIRIVRVKCTPKRFIDIIHGHNYWSYRYAYFLSMLTGIPIFTSNYGLGLWKQKRHLFFESLVFRRAAVNMAISQAILENEDPLKNLGVYDRGRIRKKLGVDNGRPILTGSGLLPAIQANAREFYVRNFSPAKLVREIERSYTDFS